MWKSFEIVRFPAFCCFQSVVHVVSERNHCTGTDTTPVIKYSDDSPREDLFNSDSVYSSEAEKLSNYCMDNSLDLNVKKTKEMLIDFRKAPTVIPDLFNDGVKVGKVTEYKYPGAVLDNKLNFNQKH